MRMEPGAQIGMAAWRLIFAGVTPINAQRVVRSVRDTLTLAVSDSLCSRRARVGPTQSEECGLKVRRPKGHVINTPPHSAKSRQTLRSVTSCRDTCWDTDFGVKDRRHSTNLARSPSSEKALDSLTSCFDCFSSKTVRCRSKCRDTQTQAAGGLPKSLNSSAFIASNPPGLPHLL
jgi:hypothetical protein